MALHQVLQGLQRLAIHQSVGSGSALSCLTRTSYSRSVSAPPCLGATVQRLLHRNDLHTSATCQRKLDTRRYPPYMFPSSNNRWELRKPMKELYEYTVKPLPFPKTGGRGPNGRIWNHSRGGGHKRKFRMVDFIRGGPTSGEPLMERVDRIIYDPNRSGRIALVASGEHKRYILATQNMKAGDIVKSSQKVTKTTVRANEGDSYPLGSLPIGTLVNCVQTVPGEEAVFARSAGVTAQLVRKLDDQCIVRLPSKREMCVSATCTATVGRVSNEDHNKRIIGKAGRNRWLGLRPSSGLKHKKDGHFGRKLNPVKPMISYKKMGLPNQLPARFRFH